MRLLLVGYGRMGRQVDALSAAAGFEVVARLDSAAAAGGEGITRERCADAEVAIDFSSPSGVAQNLPGLAALGLDLVIGTTGWKADDAQLRETAAVAGIGVVAAPNFSLGAVLFEAIVAQAARLFVAHEDYGAWLHELHHAAKRDAPSGTALALKAAMEHAGYARPIDVAATRAGSIPGTHTVGFDGPFETVTLTHTARDRATFARGALHAARWVRGRVGWFTMHDVLELTSARHSPAPNPQTRIGGTT